MKDLYKYIKESSEDGKNGHWEDFVDEDTGEIVTMWINDPTPEDIAAKEKEREADTRSYYEKQQQENAKRKELKLDELDDMVWSIEAQLKDLNQEYRELRIDMEKQQESLRKKLAATEKKRDNASSTFWKFYDKLWSTK